MEDAEQLARIEGEVTEDISVGLFLGKIYKGSHFMQERYEVAPGLWLASFSQYDFDGRKLFSGFSVHERTFIRTTGTSAPQRSARRHSQGIGTCDLGKPALQPPIRDPSRLYCLYRPIFEGETAGASLRRSLILASVLASFASLNCLAQSSQSGSDSGAGKPARNPATRSCCATAGFRCGWATAAKDQSSGKDQAKEKKKTKKV